MPSLAPGEDCSIWLQIWSLNSLANFFQTFFAKSNVLFYLWYIQHQSLLCISIHNRLIVCLSVRQKCPGLVQRVCVGPIGPLCQPKAGTMVCAGRRPPYMPTVLLTYFEKNNMLVYPWYKQDQSLSQKEYTGRS